MVKNNIFHQTKQYKRLIVGILLPIALMILLVQVLSAQQAPIAANIEVVKVVDESLVKPGDSVEYTISLNNTGDESANNVVLTDTVPSTLTVITGTVDGGYNSWGIDGNVVTWTGTVVANGGPVIINFDAVVSDTAPFEPITNTVYVTGTGSLLSSSAVLTVTDNITYYTFMPIIFKAPPVPTLLSVSQPTATSGFYETFEFVVNWSDVDGSSGGRYELQESRSPDFSNPTNYDDAGNATSKTVAHNISRHYEYYYRVRYITSNDLSSSWSNTIKQYGPYRDDFDDDTSGWFIRREDLDDTENYSYYQDNQFRMKLEGRWDFAISSSMKVVPWDSYRIKTRMRFDPSVDNLHTYGIIWGGDWDGQTPCPNEGFTSCLNHYYRINMMWYGDNNDLRVKVKRINYHDKDGIGRGTTIFDWKNIKVNDPSGKWQVWTVEQNANGDIRIYINGINVITENDANYAGAGNYLGVMAASNEYLGTNPYFDWLSVTPLP